MNLEDKVVITGLINDNMPCYYMGIEGNLEAISPQKALEFLPFFSIFNTSNTLETRNIQGKPSLIFRV